MTAIRASAPLYTTTARCSSRPSSDSRTGRLPLAMSTHACRRPTTSRNLSAPVDDPMIYVAGPVVEDIDAPGIPASVYRRIHAATATDPAFLPLRTAKLSALSPADFYAYVRTSIEESDGVITILTPNDDGTSVEAATAAELGKAQVLIVVTYEHVSRLLTGLPNVLEVIRATHESELDAAVFRAIMLLTTHSFPTGSGSPIQLGRPGYGATR